MRMRLPILSSVSRLCVATAVLMLLCSGVARSQAAADGLGARWLIAGPFAASGENALFHDQLGGEAVARPRVGAAAVTNAKWQTAVPNANGGPGVVAGVANCRM